MFQNLLVVRNQASRQAGTYGGTTVPLSNSFGMGRFLVSLLNSCLATPGGLLQVLLPLQVM